MSEVDYSNLRDDEGFSEAQYEWNYSWSQNGIILLATEEIPELEAGAYVKRARDYFRTPLTVFVIVDGDEVELHYKFGIVNFERIRRITGYLVGTLDRFNDAKRSEESERVKHGIHR